MFIIIVSAFRNSKYETEDLFLSLSLSHLQYLHSFETTVKLLAAALENSRLLRSADNLDGLASEVAKDLCCKFRFSPEIMSGRGDFRLLIRFDLEVGIGEQSKPSDLDERNCKNFNDDEIDEFVNAESADLGVNEVLANLRRGQAKVVEVLANLEIYQDPVSSSGTGSTSSSALECPICLEKASDDDDDDKITSRLIVRMGCCSHKFHWECICEWLLKNNSCPLCRSPGSVWV